MAEKTYKLKVFKYDPSVDEAPTYKTFEIPYTESNTGPLTALKALHIINNTIEPIGYDFNCRVGGCARCAIKFNGVPRLACWSALVEGQENTLEPLDNFTVIKDLLVDSRKGFAKFVQSDATVKSKAPIVIPKHIDPDLYWDEIVQADRCNECMNCYSVCTALNVNDRWENFIGPGALMQIYVKHIVGEDESDRLGQAVDCGVFQCVQCGKCSEVCSRRIPIAAHIKTMMDEATAAGLAPTADSNTYNWPLL
ncbi:MAG: succinate dehydrogenase/fumarate reductase iron-sulfur subunit [Actinobacteria bacterium]|nr:succinate dehydrogenase/fumarate reductase iron-sulfur subunit [Actinomycetota bacterium]